MGEFVSTHRLHPLLFLSLIKEEGKAERRQTRVTNRRIKRRGARLSGALVCRRSTAALA
jgi:hypothetical protein